MTLQSLKLQINYWVFVLFFLMSGHAFSQTVDIIAVTGKGIASDRSEAVSRALIEAVGKVNPTAVSAIDQVAKSSRKKISKIDGVASTDSVRTTEIDREFSQATKGVVKSWNIVSESLNAQSQFVVIVAAEVFRLKDSPQLSRKRVSIIPGENIDKNLNIILSTAVSESLTKSRKFAVLQDNNRSEIQNFIQNIRTNGRVEDLVRLRGTAAPELVIIVGLEELVESGSRLRGRISIEVIDYSSGQIKYQNSSPILLKVGDMASAQRRLKVMGSELSKQLISHIYPPLVVGWNGESMTLGLGDGFFNVGEVVQVYESLGGLRDPYTGEFLEENLRPICQAVIKNVTSRVALASPRSQCGSPFSPGSLDAIGELETRFFVVARVDYGATESPTNSLLNSRPSNRSEDFKGLFKTD
jgi:hypothetical protein